MKPIAKRILLGAACVIVLPLARAPGQAVLDKTTFGQSQNDSRDLVNSMVPGPQRFGKGEKKGEVNAADLKSKSLKDSTFGGSLLNMGIAGAEPKLDEQKLHNAQSEEAKPSKESQAGSAKESKRSEPVQEQQSGFSNLAETATLAKALDQADAQAKSESKASNSTAASSTSEPQDKQQRSTSTAADEKPSATSTEKSSAAKPDGGH
jgi:hypothetical protein